MLTDKNRKPIVNIVLETVKDISDKKYQARVWILGEGPEVDDFDETCCNFFDDGDPILENYKEYGLTEAEFLALKKFRDEFRAFAYEHYWPLEFINSPEWAKITNLAKAVLKAFNYDNK